MLIEQLPHRLRELATLDASRGLHDGPGPLVPAEHGPQQGSSLAASAAPPQVHPFGDLGVFVVAFPTNRARRPGCIVGWGTGVPFPPA